MELVIEEAGRYAMVNIATSCAGSLSTAVVTKANQVATYPVMSGSVSVPTCNGPTAATALPRPNTPCRQSRLFQEGLQRQPP
jgi:hypothetical protein